MSRRRPAPHRVGQPSPLIYHLGVALSAYGQALLAAPRADDARFPWIPGLGPEPGALAGLDQLAVAGEIAARLSATVAGLERFRVTELTSLLGAVQLPRAAMPVMELHG